MNKAEIYLKHLDQIVGRKEDAIQKVDTTNPAYRSVFVFVYKNWPEPGFITGFTFGLSEAIHPDWSSGRPELMISMESLDMAWSYSIGYMAEQMRGKCPFSYGETINFHAEICEESKLDAFLIFAPLFVNKEEWSVDLKDYTCNIAGAYPIFSSEIDLYNKIGLERFWKHPDWNRTCVRREPLLDPS